MWGNFRSGRAARSSKKDRSRNRELTAPQPVRRSRLPMLELLEMRAMLAGNTYTPLASVNDGSGSGNLRAAITSANADPGSATDTIMLGSGTYALTQGELTITNSTHSLIIQGQGSTGANATIIDQLSLDRVFLINPNVTVTFQDVQITGGVAAQGGGILSSGNLTLNNVAVIGNKAVGDPSGTRAFGGGIDVQDGSLTITGTTAGHSLIEGNSAVGFNAQGSTPASDAFGGGIFSQTADAISITGTTIADNAAIGGNGDLINPSGVSGAGEGGGAYITNGGNSSITLSNNTVSGNQAIGGSGGVGIGGTAQGGGLVVTSGNFGTSGNGPAAVIAGNTMSYNTAQGGAGGSDPTNGTGGFAFGGGIDIGISSSQLFNSTFYGNAAIGGSGVNAGTGDGGGIGDSTAVDGGLGALVLINDTIVANRAQAGVASTGTTAQGNGGGVNDNPLGAADLQMVIANTLLSENVADSDADFSGTTGHTDDDLLSDQNSSAEFTPGDDLFLPSASTLGPLQNNGGLTATVALLPGSPAIAQGDLAPVSGANLKFDQRGLGRTVSGTVDIGAYEFQGATSTTALGVSTNSVNVGQSVLFTASVTGAAVTPTGTVTFEDTVNGITFSLGSVTLSNGSAALNTTLLPQGNNSVTADYSGDTIYNGSTSTIQPVTIVVPTGNAYAPLPTVNDSTFATDNNLRNAIAAANSDTGTAGDTILLQSGTYALTGPALNITNTAHTLTIMGAGSSGPGATIIDQLALDHILQIASGATVVLENVEVTGGTAGLSSTASANGGGILNSGNLTLQNVAVVNNKAIGSVPLGGGAPVTAQGGGIFSTGPLTITGSGVGGSLIAGNSAVGGSISSVSGANSPFNGGDAVGGGVFVSLATLQLSGTTIGNNAAVGGTGFDGGVGGVGEGGGFFITQSITSPVLNGDTIAGNTAQGGNGGASLIASSGGNGGLGEGGGGASFGTSPVITNTTISGNTALGGSGGTGSQIGSGSAGIGGGLFASGNGPSSALWQLANDTLFGNSAMGGVGQTVGNAFGGAIEDHTAGMSLVNVTIASNTATAGGQTGQSFGGGLDNSTSTDSALSVKNTIFSGNTAATGPDVAGTVATTDHNLIDAAAGAIGFSVANGDKIGMSAVLGPLQNNGGSTNTLMELPGSPTIGTGDPAAATAAGLVTDQRGFPRTFGGAIDIGAYQSNTLPAPTVTNATTTENVQTSTGLVITPNSQAATFFQITAITGGTLFLNNGTTPIANGSFITVAQGLAGLKFTPATGSLVQGGFTVQGSTSNSVGGLSGPTSAATITIALAGPTVTNSSTLENSQTATGLVITPGANDSTAIQFMITNITNGSLFLHNGVTPIFDGDTISVAQGEAGLKFTPALNSVSSGSFTAQELDSSAVLSGPTATATIAITINGPIVTNATTFENTQSTSGLVLKPGLGSSGVAFFLITNINNGTLFLNNGTTAISNGQFITAAQGAAGLKFTPVPGTLLSGSFTVQESVSSSTSGLVAAAANPTITVTLKGATVTNSSTIENNQTTSGLVISPGINDTSAAGYQITGIAGGTLYQNNGVTQIANGSFISLAQGTAGLKFSPTNGSVITGSFNIQETSTGDATGLSGATATAMITVIPLAGATVTNASTNENVQSSSGLVITPSPGAAFFEITGITGGTLYQNNGTTQITNGTFIAAGQGMVGLKFTPTAGSLANGSFNIQESTTPGVGGLGGPIVAATITVHPLAGASVINASTTENTQSTSGLVILPGATDLNVSFFHITGITGGTLFLNNGTTPVTNGTFITTAQGAAGLKFTPTTGSLAAGSFTIQEANAADTLLGPTMIATISVTFKGPTVTGTTTLENAQSTSGLVITPAGSDSTATFIQITGVTGGTLYQNNGTTAIANGSFITVAQGLAGLKFTPTTNSVTNGSFIVQESNNNVAGLSGPSAKATITIIALAAPKVTSAATTVNTQTTSGLVITSSTGAGFFQITSISGGTLYQNNGFTQITSGSIITAAQGLAGLKFTPATGSLATGSFIVQESSSSSASGLRGPTGVGTITVTVAPTQSASLSNYYNLAGIWVDGVQFAGGLDGGGNALSEAWMTSTQSLGGVNFNIGPADAPDVVQAAGQTIALPNASFSKLNILATAVNGGQANQAFTVNYTDGSSQTFSQSISDWHSPQSIAGQTVVVNSNYRDNFHGTKDTKGPFDVYGYSLTINNTKTVQSITLPNDSHVEVFAISLVALVTPPTNLTATAASATSVNLAWAAATGGISGYNIYRGTTAGGESTTPINSSPLAGTATSYVDTTAKAGNSYYYVIKAISGAGTSSGSNEAAVTLASTLPGFTQVDLSSQFNLVGIEANGTRFTGGLDGTGDALSSAILGTNQSWNGNVFSIGSAGSKDVVQAAGQTVGLPNGSFSKVELLATAVNGNQANQTFVVHYTDGTSQTFTQGISDWFAPQHYAGESVAVGMAYRDQASGSEDHRTFNVYGYSFAVNNTKTIASITLPTNSHVAILAINAAV
jgi:Fibronectin type III domain